MKVCFQQFLGTNHSWSIVGQNIARALIKKGHSVHLSSTNGYEHFPADLEPYKRELLDNDYDMQVSYTAMINFPGYLAHGKKNRFGIWNYESTVLPQGFAKYYKFTDKFLPSSEFAKSVFARNGVPESHMVVVPHGINVAEYATTEVYQLATTKTRRILANIAQPHIRKNLPGLFEAYGRAFTKDDDVCLVAKVSVKKIPPKAQAHHRSNRAARRIQQREEVQKTEEDKKKERSMWFDVDFWKIYHEFERKYPQHAEVEIITDFLPSMAPLYNATQIVFSMTHAECFWLPGLEALATDNLVVAPRYGGQLDFLDDNNSLLVDGKIVRAPRMMQYWSTSPYAEMFAPDIDDAAAKLQQAVNNYDGLMDKFRPGMKAQTDRLTWGNVADRLIELCE
jgi:glycosyltransferase involved in cell wall biosynthesis